MVTTHLQKIGVFYDSKAVASAQLLNATIPLVYVDYAVDFGNEPKTGKETNCSYKTQNTLSL